MNNIDFQRFEKSVSRDRLSRYRRSGDTNESVCSKYLWNICLCESLYPTLNALEISVRNTVHIAMELRHGSMWFDSTQLPLNAYQRGCVAGAKVELTKISRPVSAGGVVAELGFGFWRSMFDRHMDRAWRSLLKNAFPNAPKHCRTVKHLRDTLDPLRRFRNRVFHHERILHFNPTSHHTEARVVIGWICKTNLEMLTHIDRFPVVYSDGLAEIRASLSKIGDGENLE